MTQFESRPPKKQPRDVPGFAQAWEAGNVPRVSVDVPQIAAGPTAYQVFQKFLVRSTVTVGMMLVILLIADHANLSSVVSGVLILVSGLVCVGLIVFVFWRNVLRSNWREMEFGYTTLQMHRWSTVGARDPWDYSGLWVLDHHGLKVIAPPNRLIDPPGYYPSPNRTGTMELWTGSVWSGKYRSSGDSSPHRS